MYTKDNGGDIHDWCFVSGKVNVLESSMFTDEFFEKLLDIETVDDIFKYIVNTKLRGYFTRKGYINDFDKLIDAHFFDNINEIRLLSPTTIICDLLLLKYKFLDMKNFIKKKLTDIPHESIPFHILKSSDMECLWKEEDVSTRFTEHKTKLYADSLSSETLPEEQDVLFNGVNNLKQVLRENREFPINNNSWIIDLIMDNAYLCYLKKVSEQIPIRYIKEYLEKFVFVKVFESLLRAVITGCNIELLKKYFLQDDLNKIYFLNLLDLPIPNWKEILIKELPVEIINVTTSLNTEKDRKNINLTKCEKLLDNYLLDIIKPVKYVTFGPERIFGFLCGLSVEAYNLKLLIGGKVNKIENQLLKDRLRNCYV